jgi:TRAP-type C4-dicarboxylate transport system substrate-binding protein
MTTAIKRDGLPRLALSLGLAFAVSALCAVAQAAEFTMKLGSSSAEDAESNFLAAIKTAIEADSKGRIEVQLYPRGQLGSQSAMIQGLQLGTIEGIHIPADFFAGVDPRMGVLSFPFLFKDRRHANRVMSDPGLSKTIAELLTAKGIVNCGPLATADVRYMLRGGIHKLADLNGKKLRINGTDAERERFKRLGATSVPMNLPDMITALQNGTIDGSGSGITIWVNFKLDSVSKELLQIEDTLILSNCAMSKKWLDTLPPDLRDIVIRDSRSLHNKGVELADQYNDILTKKWEAVGGKTLRLDAAEQADVRSKLATVGQTVTEGKPELRAFYNEVKAVSDRTP